MATRSSRAYVCAAFLAPSLGVPAIAGDCERFHDPRYVYSATVVDVYDGDTIYADIDLGFRTRLHREPLRLWGGDTPEVRGEGKEAGIAVRDIVRGWLPQGAVTIIRTLASKDGEDRTGTFHRYLAVICPDGWTDSVNARLLAEGHGTLDASSEKERAEIVEYFGLPSDE